VHTRSVGVECTGNLHPQPVLTKIIKEQRLSATLAFVVAGTRTDRIHVAPIVLGLGMNMGIPVDFGGRCLKNFGPQPFVESQHIDRAMNAGLSSLHRINCLDKIAL
jgi:hypothetical protein